MDAPALVPAHVLAAFGVAGAHVVALDGGQGSSVRAGGLVLKPYADELEVTWFAGVAARTARDGFRLPEPVASSDGRWTVDGWSAVEHVAGVAEPEGRWSEVVAAGRAFHAATARETRPEHLDLRSHRWALADRVAWDDVEAVVGTGSRSLLARLGALTAPIDLPAQLVHGDLSGNVLLAEGLAPAIIDVSPYWRPAAYADAVLVVDALLWWDAAGTLVDAIAPATVTARDWTQLLVRAAVFRVVSLDEAARADDPEVVAQLPLYDRVVTLLELRSATRGG